MKPIRLAFAGDIHGDIEQMLARVGPAVVDAIVELGDFETVRGPEDLDRITGPRKYRKLGDFGSYWREERQLPVPIHFIGGNHEVYAGYLEDRADGAELAPRVHYLGRVGVAEVAGVRMAWLSGIYNPATFDHERGSEGRRATSLEQHTYYRRHEVDELDAQMAAAGHIDVLLLHDWPCHLERHATVPMPRRLTPEFHCQETYDLIVRHQPGRVFCGHMHWPLSARIGETQIECLPHIDHDGSVQVVDFLR